MIIDMSFYFVPVHVCVRGELSYLTRTPPFSSPAFFFFFLFASPRVYPFVEMFKIVF